MTVIILKLSRTPSLGLLSMNCQYSLFGALQIFTVPSFTTGDSKLAFLCCRQKDSSSVGFSKDRPSRMLPSCLSPYTWRSEMFLPVNTSFSTVYLYSKSPTYKPSSCELSKVLNSSYQTAFMENLRRLECLPWVLINHCVLIKSQGFHRPNLPATPRISRLHTFTLDSPVMKGHLFWVLVLESLVSLHRTVQFQLLQQ
ncbi:uncharacterized protein LOC123465257 isoform X2 [Bubalus bubalis]|uniref:uncharacterized protein LOC123465257 isoform X2 n=1 Tax=Bubalus bubalis TaxID=89462 RepID=UPI001E1B7A7C|nr:uncharacterized protein LOC123465257 isoform X2 [Bubalus bubalis]